MNEYARFLAQQRGSRSLGEFERGVVKQLPQISSAYGQRGLQARGVRSGIFNRAIKEFGQEAARQRGYMTQDLAEEQRGFQLRETQGRSDLEQALADLEAEKARAIAESAQGLLNLR
jgi:ClpP class serine protease